MHINHLLLNKKNSGGKPMLSSKLKPKPVSVWFCKHTMPNARWQK